MRRLKALGVGILIAVWATTAAPCIAADQRAAPESSGAVAETGVLAAPVTLDGELLFWVRGVTAFPAAQRAAGIAERIRALADDSGFRPETLTVAEETSSTNIMAGAALVVAVLDADASREGVQRQQLAQAFVIRIRGAIETYRLQRSRPYLTAQAFKALGLTVALVLSVLLLLRLARRLDRLVEARYRRRVDFIGTQSVQIVEPERIWSALRRLLRSVRALVLVGLGYAYLGYVLGAFPWTRPLASRLLDYVIGPLQRMGVATVAFVPNLVFLLILTVVTRYALGLLRLLFAAIEQGTMTMSGFEREWALPTYRIARLAAVAFAVVVAYPYLPGSDSEAFKAVSIFLGVLFSLGSSSVIANVIAGYTMTYRRAFKVGDRIRIDDALGDVAEIRLLVTRLRSLKNEDIVIPNSVILNSQVVNYSSLARTQGLILHTTVGIGYEVPWRQVEAMLRLAAERTPGLLAEPAPFIRQESLGDFAVQYELNVYCDDAQRMTALYTALHRNILDVFNEYGVQVMTPAYEGDPAQPKVVPKDQWYAAPARPVAGENRHA